ncbi:dihydrolipoyl dehydrogenase [Algoriphagus sp. NG3]|uniref:dihydrolipoyl dehydrogenase n=1 Tax=Algoriphagus sp. NG3 TaxID=3097546 RepID=UPI002A806CD1|nr:dihydrolipoyl dehydrogenase [Algoriphagus sp. NG3]WPR75958.1 dihydrolipoyl dehydrogenase [Algoriphagus sp. NG3]
MAKSKEKELVIIGAGPGGYAAAFRAADLGLQVTLIGTDIDPGGTCLYEGCIPSKTLIEVLKTKDDAATAKEWGLEFGKPTIDVEALATWKDEIVKKLTGGVGLLSTDREIEYIKGKAVFLSENELEIQPVEGKPYPVTFKNAILATGAVPKELPEAKFDSERIIDSTTALELKEIPKRMLVIGGGYIGPSLGSIYASLGSKVTLVEETKRLLSWVDPDLATIYTKENEGLFKTMLFETTLLKEVKVDKKKVKVKLETKGKEWEETFDLVLVAMGRIPNTQSLDLEKAGIETDSGGFIQVDDQRRTAKQNVFAIGDLVNQALFANKASHEGKFVAGLIAGKHRDKFDPKAIPSIVATTRTEMAWCGLTEAEAKQQEIEIRVAKFPWSASGRAASMGLRRGLTKLIIDSQSNKILGGGVVGEKAGSLIAEIAFALQISASAEDIALTVHPHPTLSESIMEAAEAYQGTATHLAGG